MKFDCSKRGASRIGGFTLIEMLVVVVVIIILMGIVFRMTHVASRTAARAETYEKLEAVKACIEEFNSEYGYYPPVAGDRHNSGIGYEFPGNVNPDVAKNMVGENAFLFNFGLTSYFVARYNEIPEDVRTNCPSFFQDDQWKDYNAKTGGDLPRDVHFANRIKPYLSKVGLPHRGGHLMSNEFGRVWTNKSLSLPDGFGKSFIYMTKPPYASYSLFSAGPDGKYDAKAPFDISKKVNKDNIYGNIGE